LEDHGSEEETKYSCPEWEIQIAHTETPGWTVSHTTALLLDGFVGRVHLAEALSYRVLTDEARRAA
jgi:hypothetical protein